MKTRDQYLCMEFTTMRFVLFAIVSILLISCQRKNQKLESREIDYYFDQLEELKYEELIKQEVFIDSVTIADTYLDKETGQLNKKDSKSILILS